MTDDRTLLLRFLDGDLPAAERADVQARLARDPALRAQLGRLQALQQTLEAGKPDAFAPYFSERVLRRLADVPRTSAEPLYESLRWLFVRTAVACLFLVAALGAANVADYQSLGVASSTIEALFGLPSTSLLDALAYGGL